MLSWCLCFRLPVCINLGRERIRDLLIPIVSLWGLKLPHRAVVLRALDLYAERPMDFVDALAAAYMMARRVTEIHSYGEHFDGIQGIKRVEP